MSTTSLGSSCATNAHDPSTDLFKHFPGPVKGISQLLGGLSAAPHSSASALSGHIHADVQIGGLPQQGSDVGILGCRGVSPFSDNSEEGMSVTNGDTYVPSGELDYSPPNYPGQAFYEPLPPTPAYDGSFSNCTDTDVVLPSSRPLKRGREEMEKDYYSPQDGNNLEARYEEWQAQTEVAFTPSALFSNAEHMAASV
ncbi:hypothetical protein BT69DRAFT_1139662 [Atractiella rhizophila]|nr:hypothetical protein BT69DRAFT_1139662 [Atractiella rhizophila]